MSGPVRKPDEILPADAASGAGRTPADRPAVPTAFLWTHKKSVLLYCAYLLSPAGRQVAVIHKAADADRLCLLLNEGEAARAGVRFVDSLLDESAREHVRNALEMLTNCGDDKFLIGNERRVVYDADVIDAVKTWLNKALGS